MNMMLLSTSYKVLLCLLQIQQAMDFFLYFLKEWTNRIKDPSNLLSSFLHQIYASRNIEPIKQQLATASSSQRDE